MRTPPAPTWPATPIATSGGPLNPPPRGIAMRMVASAMTSS